MTFDCVTILVDLVLAGVFEAWKEIYSEATHLFLAFFILADFVAAQTLFEKLNIKWQFDIFHHWVL